MDPDVEIMYSVPDSIGIRRNQLGVNLQPSFNRITPLPQKFQSSLDETWKNRCSENPKLWNGTKFRLHSVNVSPPADDVDIVFNLGITDYKDFLGTNWSSNAKDLALQGMSVHKNSHAYMSDALGVGNLVITKDNQVIFIRRSHHCSEAVGLFDVPGGHPEPEVIVGRIDASQIKLEDLVIEDVVNEIFNSTLNEVCEEINIPVETLSDPVLMGVARNMASAGRPSSEYIIYCSLTSQDIMTKYLKGTQSEADESTELKMVPLEEILILQENILLWPQLAPSAKGCIILYQLMASKTDC